MAFENLSVRVSANTSSANASLNRVEDNLEEVGDEAQSTSRSFGTLSASTGVLQGSLTGLSTVTMATAVPAFLTLSTVMAPLAVVFGGIAAAAGSLVAVFGGLAAAGVVTHMDELQTAMANARAEIIQIIQPLGEVFGPVLVDAVQALPSLVQAVVDSLGPLDQFRDTLIRMGQTAQRVIPQIASGMFNLAEAALPALNQALSALNNQGPGVFRTLRDVFNQVFPLVADLGSAIAGLTPDLLDMGTTIASIVIPALTDMVDIISNLITRFNQLKPQTQDLVGTITLLAPVISAAASVLAGLSAPIIAIIGVLAGLAVAYQENLFGFKDAIDSTVPSLSEMQNIGEQAFEKLQTLLKNIVRFTQPFIRALAELGRALRDTARAITVSLQPAFRALGRTIRNIRQPIQSLAKSIRNVLTGVVEFLTNVVLPAFEFVFEETIAPVINKAADAVSENLGPVISELSDTLDVLSERADTVGEILKRVWTEVEPVVTPIVNGLADIFGTVLAGAIEAVSESLQFLMNLIQGDFSGAMNNLENLLTNFIDTVTGVAESIGTAFSDALEGLVPILKDWVGAGADYLSGTGKNSAIGDITTGAKTFGGAVADAVGLGLDLASIAVDAVKEMGDAFADGVIDIAEDIASFGEDVANTLIDAINDAIPNELSFGIDAVKIEGQTVVPAQTVSANIPNNPVPSAQTGAFVEGGGLLNVHQGEQVVPAAQVTDRGTVNVDGGQTEVMVTLEGDTDVIRDVSTEVIREKERRAKRNTGGTNQV